MIILESLREAFSEYWYTLVNHHMCIECRKSFDVKDMVPNTFGHGHRCQDCNENFIKRYRAFVDAL